MIVKVCGMREPENIAQVEQAGATWMGFICWEGSSRHVAQRPAYLPSCRRVGVFVDATPQYIMQQKELLGLDILQLHGHETPEQCRQLHELTSLPIMKAISVAGMEDLRRAASYEDSAQWLLFDTKCVTVGGSGRQFDWSILAHYHGGLPFLLSGGIGPEDIPQLASFAHPQWKGIDVNSKFETSPAMKDAKKVRHFIQEFRAHFPEYY